VSHCRSTHKNALESELRSGYQFVGEKKKMNAKQTEAEEHKTGRKMKLSII